MKRLGNLGRGLLMAAVTVLGTTTTANAAPMLFTLEGESYGDLGATVLFTYTATSNLTGRVDVQVTNTSTAYDPRLTGFAFNLPGSVLAMTGFTSSLSGWSGTYDRNDIDTPGQFGFYDLAGATGSNPLNGGSPNFGIARNVTANFSFNLLGVGMMGLTETSFLNLLSNDPGRPNEDTQYFIARFQRVGAGGALSDVATPDGPPTPPTSSVPEPTTLMLSGLGLIGLAALRRRAA